MDWSSRLKNWGFWLSTISLVLLAVYPQIACSFIQNSEEITKTVLGLLSLLGIVSNPTAGAWYLDHKKETASGK